MIYDKIKKICHEKGISVNSVEKQACLSNGIISKWNKVSPTVENIRAVAKALDVPIEQLLE